MYNIIKDSDILSSFSKNDDIVYEDYELNEDDYLRLCFLNPERESDSKDNEPPKEPKTIDKVNIIQPTNVSMDCTNNITIKKNMEKVNPNITKIDKSIFKITKTKKKNIKKGRLDKKSKKRYYGKHSKFTQDNIIRKIKASFIEKSMNYINREYDLYMNKHQYKKIKRLIQKISPVKSREISKNKNLKWFQSKLRDLFSSKLSKKCTLSDPDYNITSIDELYKNNTTKNVIDLLNKPVKEMYYIYSQDIETEGFKTLKDDLIRLRKKMEKNNEEDIEEYLEKYKNIAQNLEKIFLQKKERNTKKNKSEIKREKFK